MEITTTLNNWKEFREIINQTEWIREQIEELPRYRDLTTQLNLCNY